MTVRSDRLEDILLGIAVLEERMSQRGRLRALEIRVTEVENMVHSISVLSKRIEVLEELLEIKDSEED